MDDAYFIIERGSIRKKTVKYAVCEILPVRVPGGNKKNMFFALHVRQPIDQKKVKLRPGSELVNSNGYLHHEHGSVIVNLFKASAKRAAALHADSDESETCTAFFAKFIVFEVL